MYVASNLSKNIQVVDTAKGNPSYALAQEEIPISIKGYDVFLLVTSYGKRSLDVISLNDDKVIKEIDFKTQPDEIVLDEKNKLAYISSGESTSIYVISLETMTLKRQLRINGLCEKLTLSDDGTKLFYNDKQTREIWAVELDNNYLMKLVGKFPNVSKIEYLDGKIYITSRTKNRLAIIDYDTMGLMSENQISSKPVDMVSYKGSLFVLCAGDRVLDIIDTSVDSIAGKIELENTFPTRITQIGDSNIAVITDAMGGLYSILDMDKKEIIKTNKLDIPVNAVYITNVVKKIGSK
jgi:DNA-binding beta-propeller fold protein YncE